MFDSENYVFDTMMEAASALVDRFHRGDILAVRHTIVQIYAKWWTEIFEGDRDVPKAFQNTNTTILRLMDLFEVEDDHRPEFKVELSEISAVLTPGAIEDLLRDAQTAPKLKPHLGLR